MSRYELTAFSTEERGEASVRLRDYTTSDLRAEAWNHIPRINFTDSGHGIVYQSRVMARYEPRKTTKGRTGSLMEHAYKHLAEATRKVKAGRRRSTT